MKSYILLASLLFTVAARADDPVTVILPSSIVTELEKYLVQRPYIEVAQLLAKLQACLVIQVPNQGAKVDQGACPDVTAALQKGQK